MMGQLVALVALILMFGGIGLTVADDASVGRRVAGYAVAAFGLVLGLAIVGAPDDCASGSALFGC
jgi:hypothetical protein